MKSVLFFLFILAFSASYAQEGLVKTYYLNHSLKSEINYQRSIRNGIAKFYSENGKIKEEVTYINGKVEGLVKQYNENGILKELYTIEDGKRQGPTSFYDSTGTWIEDMNFDKGIVVIETVKKVSPTKTGVASNDSNKKSGVVKNDINKTEEKTLPPVINEETSDEDPSYQTSAEVMAEPVGGIAELQRKLIYPAYAKEHNVEGTVEIRAFIDQNGVVTIAEVVKGIGYGCDDVARITVLYAKFNPGLIRGKPVKTQVIIPLEFKSENEN